MNRVYRLVWNSSLEMFVAVAELARAKKKTGRTRTAAVTFLAITAASSAANATTFIDFNGGLGSWTTGGNISVSSTTVTVPTGGATFTLTPAAGYDMARINAPNGGNILSPNATLGLSANSLESFLNNGNGHITNFGLLTKSFNFNVGTYTFAWAYGAEDYQPYNDGAVFSLAGGGSQSLISLARNGSSPSDTSGPSPGTQILGSYGATPWITTSFDITTAGSYQVGFSVYNWNDTSLAPNLYVSGIEGTFTGTPVQTSGTPPVIGGTGGNVSGSIFDPSSAAYAATELTFAGGTLQYTSDLTTSKDAVLTAAGGAIDTNGFNVDYTGAISGSSDFYKEGAGNLNLTNINTYTGKTNLNAGTLVLTGAGSIASSSELVNNSTLDISGTTTGASLQTLSGTGIVLLGTKNLALTNASTTFAGNIDGAGSVDLVSGNLSLTGANVYTGNTNINGGTLKLVNLGSIATSNVVNIDSVGTLDIADTTSGASVQTIAGTGAVELGGKTLTLTNGAGTFDGIIKGTGVVKLASGNIALGGVNTYTGLTQIDSGTLTLTGNGSIASSNELVNNSTLDISGTTTGASLQTLSGSGIVLLGTKNLALTNASTTFAGNIDGAGSVDLASGNLSLTGANVYTGSTNINGGTLKLANLGSVATSNVVNIASIGILDIADTTSGASVQTIAGTGAVELGDKTLTLTNGAGTFDGIIKGTGVVKLASGNIVLGGVNTYTGLTQIDSGTLTLTGNGSIESSSGVLNNGILDVSNLTDAPKLKTLSGNGVVNLGSKSLTLTDAAGTYDGGFSGAGSVNVDAGTITLAGASTQTGGFNVSNGAKIIVANDAALGDAASPVNLNNAILSNLSTITLANNINLAGVSTFDTASGGSITTTGALSGAGSLVKQGAGTLVLASDNSAFGLNDPTANIVVNQGSLTLKNAKSLGNAGVILNAGSLSAEAGGVLQNSLVIAPNTSISTTTGTTFTVSGPITSTGSGNGCFEKTGTGTLVMAGRADIAPGTCVQDGKLYANGLLNSVVTVQTDGVLRGTGTIAGPTTVYGRIAPGNSPGTLTSTATVTMTAGSVYQEDINGTGTGTGPGNYSRLIVTGANSQFVAAGATLEPNLTNITGTDTYIPYVPKLGDAFRIITAEGGIVGEFDSITQPAGLAANTKFEVYYDIGGSHSIDLFVIPTSYRAYVGGVGGNENAQSTGGAIDTLFGAKAAETATPSQEALLYSVSGHIDSTLESFATSLAGEVHAATAAAAPLANHWLVDSVGRQLSQGSQGVWVDVGANRSDWDSDSVASGFDTNRSQVAIGADVVASDAGRIGLGFTHAKVDVQTIEASGSVSHDIGFVYGQLNAGPVVVEGMGALGSSDWETDRRDPVAPLTSLTTDFRGHDVMASVGVRLPFEMASLALSPYVRGTWERISREAFNEGSASLAALTSADYDRSGTRVTAGLLGGSTEQNPVTDRFAYQFNIGVGRDASGIARASFGATLAGVETTISSPDVGRTFVFGQLGATARLLSNLFGYVGVSGETRSGKSEDLGANLGVRMTF